MTRHWRYLLYVMRHKWFVLVAGWRVGAPLWRLLIHDWTKFTPAEWGPYVQFFYGHRPPDWSPFERAWLHHQHWNPHHWQHWILRLDSGKTKVLPMPEHFVREMVADWMGAGRAITGRWEAAEWYEKNAGNMQLHDATRHRVEMLLAAHGNARCGCGATGSLGITCARFGYCAAHLVPWPPGRDPNRADPPSILNGHGAESQTVS